MLKNGLLYGSFNPLHLSHIDLIGKALEYFETLHVFARYTEGVDMVDWETKKAWLERVNDMFDHRLRIYKLELAIKGKQYGKLNMAEGFLNSEKQAGVFLDGLVCGEDMRYMADAMKAALPDRTFIVIPRDERSSSGIRGKIDTMKDEMPEFVYRDLKEWGILMKNGLLYGSFSPLHNSHVSLIEKGLEYFDVLHIFVRSMGAKDIASYETKKSWLETLNGQLGGKLRIYPLTFPEGSLREDGSYDLAAIFAGSEKQAGVRIDGMISGSDKDVWLDVLKPAFPDKEFIVIPRSEIRSHEIRNDIEGLKGSVPDYVYQTLKQ